MVKNLPKANDIISRLKMMDLDQRESVIQMDSVIKALPSVMGEQAFLKCFKSTYKEQVDLLNPQTQKKSKKKSGTAEPDLDPIKLEISKIYQHINTTYSPTSEPKLNLPDTFYIDRDITHTPADITNKFVELHRQQRKKQKV